LNTNKPLISIITPCFNASKYLKDAIESVLNQSHKNFEWIIINDGSTDDSEAIIQSFDDPRIRYYKQENKGQCSASNFGLRKATGNYIKFFDADDVMNVTHLEGQVERLNGRTDALASCAWGRFYNDEPLSARFIPETVWQDLDSLTWIKLALSQRNDMMGAWLWLIPKNVLEKTGGWNEDLSLNNDFEFSIRLLLAVKEVLFVENAKIYYRSGLSSLSQHTSEKAYRAAILSTDLGVSNILEVDNSDTMKKLCANRYQEWMYRIYPDYSPILKDIENKIILLGGSDRKMEGGKVFKLFSFFVGWKSTKRFRNRLIKIGYSKLPFNSTSKPLS
jgi:glycosyltransferase involved in cell wall biosynthesis